MVIFNFNEAIPRIVAVLVDAIPREIAGCVVRGGAGTDRFGVAAAECEVIFVRGGFVGAVGVEIEFDGEVIDACRAALRTSEAEHGRRWRCC
jgi:hypothetical protein